MAHKTDIALFPVQAGVISMVHCLGDFADVGIDNNATVELDPNPASPGHNLLTIPPADRLLTAPYNRDHTVNGTVILIRLKILILVGAIIEYLDFHSMIGGINV